MSFELTPKALEDLDEIWWFIAADDRSAADRVEAEIVSTCRLLARFPSLGHKRPDMTALPVLFWTVPRFPNFVIVYRPESRPLQVIAILNGKQMLANKLSGR